MSLSLSCRLSRLLLPVPMLLLGACASMGGGPSGPVNEQAVNALYGQLDQASQAYQTAIDQQRSGDQAASQQTLDNALDTLKKASAQCADTAGCDPQRFFSVFDHLLRLKDGSFAADDASAAEDDADTPEADQTTGETSPILKDVPQAQRSVTLLRGHKLSDLIAMNGAVKSALEEWLTWLRPNLMKAYINYEYLRYRMWPAYKKADLPEALLFGILAKESGGKVHAVSRSGAAGPLQFMYATGRRFGLVTKDGFDERFDPALAAKANAEYLNEQLKVFNDNLELVLGAYNGGEGRMRRLVGGHTAVSFYDPKIYFSLPRETREYVPMVLAAAWLFMHPDSYHLTFPRIDGKPGHITLTRQASLSELSICLGQAHHMRDGWFRTLRNLNPRLDPQKELDAGTRLQVPKILVKPYKDDCQDGPWPILAADLHSGTVPTPPPPPPSGLPARYRVRHGDTLGGIVSRLGCSSVHRVARLNHLRGPHYRIRVGQHLRLPRCHR
ncbi:lytic transglycosylase domain-containing protein [Oleiagrimonas sp. C23AA]|uniref:lytic transglycosylase domain-containing protein n=1 Tax=Oleiagrimonas sp. C23AA TaxID=2719047 RepID=UPI00141D8438|nr:lytic transglycosylase domain-containing protein [Oleiagrimonas sp. C23AA]NII10116.1 transglycosylase SLT domain-containing protein [Oleiagrimonas sp. C23AA]